MQSKIWIGTVEISFSNPREPSKVERAFTVVTTWASDLEEFCQKTNQMLESYGWKLLGIEKANPVPDDGVFSLEVEGMLERTRSNPSAIIYGTFHTYPVN
jgi:hypothetical protein